MLFGKLISLFLVTAILNPICCCNAELFADTEPVHSAHDCCPEGEGEVAGTDASGQEEASCEVEDKCLVKPEGISHHAQQLDVKSLAPQVPLEPDLLWSWLGIAPLAGRTKAAEAQSKPVCHWADESPTSLRLHGAKCVYLI